MVSTPTLPVTVIATVEPVLTETFDKSADLAAVAVDAVLTLKVSSPPAPINSRLSC